MNLTTIQSFKVKSINATGVDMHIEYSYSTHRNQEIRIFDSSAVCRAAKELLEGSAWGSDHAGLIERLLELIQ